MSDSPISLASLMTPSKTVSIDFPGYSGMSVDVCYLAREELVKLRKKCVSTRFDKKTRQPEEVLDEEKFLIEYFRKEPVEAVIIGHLTNLDDTDTHATPLVQAFINRFKKIFPTIPIIKVDERFTSKMAVESMVASGMKKKNRQNKSLVDEIAATIMLQQYLSDLS